jgi:carbamoylphosphate synthase large subunit
VTPEFVERVIEKERPDGILLSFGGQTALNCGVALYEKGVLEKYGVKVLGTPVQAIIDTEDRDLFVKRLDEIDVKTIKSEACSTVEEVQKAAHELGFPVILRAAYALGGLGSGFCDNEEELLAQAEEAFNKFMTTGIYKDFNKDYDTFLKKNPGYEERISTKLA